MESIIKEGAHRNPILGWCEGDLEWQAFGDRDDRRFRNVRFGDTDPEYLGGEPDWPVTLAGSSGWNPVDQRSVWVGVDIDSVDHARGIAHVDEIVSKCSSLAYVQVQRSKGGQGVHLYARFNPDSQPFATTRGAHKRNAERVARQIEIDTGLNLIGGDADCLGAILWLFTSTPRPESFAVLSLASEFVPDDLPDLPPRKAVPAVNDVDATDFDAEHRSTIEAWSQSGFAVHVDTLPDGRRCVRVHTKAVSVPTNSDGTDPRTPNAFAFPVAGGGFVLYRFGDVKECPPWFTTKNGRTCCLLGVRDIEIAARLRLRSHKGSFLGTVAEMASIIPDLDATGFEDRPAELCREDAQWIVSVASRKPEPLPRGWLKQGYKALFFIDGAPIAPPEQVYAIVEEATTEGAEAGDFMRVEGDEHVFYTERKLELALSRDGRSQDQTNAIKRNAITLRKRTAHLRSSRIEDNWLNIGARLKIAPKAGDHPTWTEMEEHIGSTLTPHLTPWCHDHNIHTGGDWLRTWRSVAFQRPDRPTPFLTLISKAQGTGKTSYVNSLKLLVEGGIAGATGMLSRNSNFNAHVTRSWLAVIAESDISGDGTYDSLKGLITDDDAESEAKFQQAMVVRNYCHFIQTANHLRYYPLGEPGDTRIVVIRVPPIAVPLDRDELKARLTEEAPAYLHTLLKTPLPKPCGRLWLPIIDTPERRLLIEMRTSPVERFLSEHVEEAAHERIPAADFVERLQRWYVETLGKGDSIGKQEVYAQLRVSESSITYVPNTNGAYIVNARWKDV